MAKTFFKDGKWIDKTDAPEVVVCSCGNKYIKTRDGQIQCLRCASAAKKR
ncbi:hypothetical protein HY970_00295 [Candidatus Kaiserbacteria bacterium]|nr:hypothetical protein [Candidatus Kaiserbacteria bacterium]